MKFCPKCKGLVDGIAVLCPQCAHRLGSRQAAPRRLFPAKAIIFGSLGNFPGKGMGSGVGN